MKQPEVPTTTTATAHRRRRRRQALTMGLAFAATITITPAFAKDPCPSFVCMVGKLQGSSGGDSCAGPINDYFSIISYHHGHIDLSATPTDRLNYLKQCGGADPGLMQAINAAFGTLTG